MSGGATGDRRGTAAGSKGVGSGTATGNSGSNSLGDHDGSQLRELGSSAAAAADDRRLTRSRARELGLEMQNAAWPELGGRKGKKRGLAAEEGPKELESLPEEKSLEKKKEQQEGTQMSVRARGVRISRGHCRDRGSMISKRDAQLLDGAPWLVHVSSTDLDGKEILRCSGTIIHWDKEKAWILTSYHVVFCKHEARLYSPMPKMGRRFSGAVAPSSTSPIPPDILPGDTSLRACTADGKEILRCSGTIIHWDKEKAWILTSYHVVFCKHEARLYSPMPKLAVHVEKAVHLPNKGKHDGKMLFFSERYQLALIEVESTVEVNPPRDGSRPQYNEKVKTLARDEKMSLKLHRGTIMWEEENCFLFANCKLLQCGTGGPVINNAGEIVGMSCYYSEDLAILSITTIRLCITMWTKFGRVARPMLGMSFRTVKLLDIVRQDLLSYKYKISDGFIVDEVTVHSDAEKHGIRRGNVISFSNVVPCYLPEFEDYLLNIGLDSLNGTSRVKDFKFEVNDLVGKEPLFCPCRSLMVLKIEQEKNRKFMTRLEKNKRLTTRPLTGYMAQSRCLTSGRSTHD